MVAVPISSHSFGTKERFWEVGIGASYPTIVGGSITGYYVHEPWKWPWRRDWWPWQKDKDDKKGKKK
jgi:hypothetical protein